MAAPVVSVVMAVYDVATQTSTLINAGGYGHLSLLGSGSNASATPYGTGCAGLVIGTTGLPQLGNASFRLVLWNVPAVSPVGLFAFGSQAINPGIDLTSLGMAGCFAYTSLDIGLLTGSPVNAAGVSTFPSPPSNLTSCHDVPASPAGADPCEGGSPPPVPAVFVVVADRA